MVRKLFSSVHIPRAQKKECFADLAQRDESDMLGRTQKYCEAADPDLESKGECFMTIFEGSDKMSL